MPDPNTKLDKEQLNSIKDLMHEKFPAFIEEILENLQSHMEKILHALEQKDINAIEKSAHSLGSNSSYIGAMHIHDLAKKIEHIVEDQAKSGVTDIPVLTPLIENLQAKMMDLKTEIHQEVQSP